MNGPAIVVEHLVKRYGGRAVVDDLTFAVQPGELFALLGPNGAGKTTTVEILEGYRTADSGVVRVLGLDPRRDGAALKPRIGLMLQGGGVYPAAYPEEVLRLFAAFYPKPRDPVELLQLVGLDEARRTRYRRMSGGQRQRLSLALALVGRPEVLFLDEPTAAMDPQARQATWELIRGLKQEGVTILLTTHFMDEAERLADRVAIIDHGRLVALDTPRNLIEGGGQRAPELLIRTEPPVDRTGLVRRLGVPEVAEDPPGVYRIRVRPTPELIADLAAWLRQEGVLLRELRTGHRTLEDVFLSLTGHELRD